MNEVCCLLTFCLNVCQKLLFEANIRLGEILSTFEFSNNEKMNSVSILMAV